MTRRGTGDEGLAEDLLPLAEVVISPPVDWDALGPLLVELNATDLDEDERAALVKKARAAANGDPSANAMIDRKLAK